MRSKIFGHVSIYSAANLLVTAGGLITFPILTRVFSVADYGALNLISATLLLLVALGKLGMQHAVVRLYSEIRAGKHKATIDTFVSTITYFMLVAGGVVGVLWAVAVWISPASLFEDRRMHLLLLLTALLVPIRVLDSGFVNLMRAQERATALAIYSVARRYGGLVIILGILFGVSSSIWGFYTATILGELAAVVGVGLWLARSVKIRPSLVSGGLLRVMLGFGVPMIGYELSGITLQLGDRYVLNGLLGTEAVGMYSAAYNLCEYVQGVVIAAVAQAVMPTYLRIFEEQGPKATSEFLGRFLRVYAMVSMPIAAGLAGVGEQALEFLASDKYTAGAVILPYVIGGMAIDGVTAVTGAGLYIQKRSKTIVVLVTSCAVVNVLLNFALIPLMGIAGSGLATFLSYLMLALLSMWIGRSALKIPVPVTGVLKFGAIALAMYFLIQAIRLESTLATLCVRMVVGAVFYTTVALLTDAQCRSMARTALQKINSLRGARAAGSAS